MEKKTSETREVNKVDCKKKMNVQMIKATDEAQEN